MNGTRKHLNILISKSNLHIAFLLILSFLLISCVSSVTAPRISPPNSRSEAGLETLLVQIPAENAADIRSILNTAPAAYKELFLEYAGKIRIEETTGAQRYDAKTKTVYLDFSRMVSDPRGPYTAFFHECAHAIDDAGNKLPGCSITGSGKLTGNTLKSALDEDYRSFITGEVLEITVSENMPQQTQAQIDTLIEQMRGGMTRANKLCCAGSSGVGDAGSCSEVAELETNQAVKNGIDQVDGRNDQRKNMGTDLNVYLISALENRLCPALYGPEQECLSDILGGLSGGCLRGKVQTTEKIKYGYGHESSYWETDGNLEKEFFAEYFSYQMTGNQEALRKIAAPSFGVFPQAAAWIDARISD